MISIFKLIGGITTEFINILLILESDNIGDVVKDFIAFGVIADIDDLMA